MDLERKDKVVLITGGSKGIGAGISRALAAEAAIPLIVDRDLEAANAPHPQLPCSELVIAELSSHESCYAAIDHAVRTFSGRDALVHNAGVNDEVGLEHGSPQKYFESLERTFSTTTSWPTSRCRITKSRGPIVNIASKAAQAEFRSKNAGPLRRKSPRW